MTPAAAAPDTEATAPPEYVVLLDDHDQPCGQALKAQVHTTATPLHLAFSCWVLDDQGRVLLTRRAASKLTWPAIWTNSFCGHPAPGEALEDAVHRRAAQELGTRVADLTPALPTFRYTATMPNGVMENEFCPVFTARLAAPLAPDPAEVDDWQWVSLDDLRALARDPGAAHSPWLLLQLPQLLAGDQLGPAR